MDTDLKAVLIKGRFSERDWKEMMELLRRIEQRHPDEDYWATIIDSGVDPSSTEAMEFMKRTYPTRPGHKLDIFLRPKNR